MMFSKAMRSYFQDPRGYSDPVPGKFRGFQIPDSQSSVFDMDIIASPMTRESACFSISFFLSKTLVFLETGYPRGSSEKVP